MKGHHIIAVVILAFVATCLALPQNKIQVYDEPRLSNEVIPGTIEQLDLETSEDTITSTVESNEGSTTIKTEKPALDDVPTPKPGNKKKTENSSSPQTSDTFSRVIDDIFNIPISVLRAVNTLLSNAFGTRQTSSTATSSSK